MMTMVSLRCPASINVLTAPSSRDLAHLMMAAACVREKKLHMIQNAPCCNTAGPVIPLAGSRRAIGQHLPLNNYIGRPADRVARYMFH